MVSGFLIRLTRYRLTILSYTAAPLCHVRGFPTLRLLRELRCHAEYSGAAPIAFRLLRLDNPRLANLVTWYVRLSDAMYTPIRFMAVMSQ